MSHPLRRFAPLAALLLCLHSPTAEATLAGRQSGVWAHVAGGLGAGDNPFRAGVGWSAAVGGWFGKYDDSFSLGRHVGIGLAVRQDLIFRPDERILRTAPMLQVHRGIDLLVVGLELGGTVGPLLETTLGGPTRVTGGTARVVGALKYRFVPNWSLFARLDAGVDVETDAVQASLGFLLGFQLAVPTRGAAFDRRKQDRTPTP
jgi:hypothetical protein